MLISQEFIKPQILLTSTELLKSVMPKSLGKRNIAVDYTAKKQFISQLLRIIQVCFQLQSTFLVTLQLFKGDPKAL